MKAFNSISLLTAFFVMFSIGSCSIFFPDEELSWDSSHPLEYVKIMGNDSIELEMNEKQWMVNKRWVSDEIAIENLLYALENLEVTGYRNSLETDSLSGIRVIAQSGRHKKIYRYYRTEGQDILHLEGSTRLKTVQVKAASGASLENIFSDDESYWRNKKLFDFIADDIQNIEAHPAIPGMPGFEITKANSTFRVNSAQLAMEGIDDEKVLLYMSFWNDIYFESILSEPKFREQTAGKQPFFRFLIRKDEGQEIGLKLYKNYDHTGKEDLFFGSAHMSHRDEYYRVNYVYLDKLFQDAGFFVTDSN